MELQRCENYIFFLPVNICTHGVACWFLGPHDTLPCVFIYWYQYSDIGIGEKLTVLHTYVSRYYT